MTEALISQAPGTSNNSNAVPSGPERGSTPTPAEVEAAVHILDDRSRQAARQMFGANRALKDSGLLAIGAAMLERKDVLLFAKA